jgi:hypothetical protein
MSIFVPGSRGNDTPETARKAVADAVDALLSKPGDHD